MNWLCRMIGHKWLTKRRHKIDGAETEEREIWGCCVRCGEPAPAELEGAWYSSERPNDESGNGKA